LWLSQSIRWTQAAYVGDCIDAEVRITHVSPHLRTIVLETKIFNDRKELLVTGEAKTMMLAQGGSVAWEEMVVVITGGSRGIGAGVARAFGHRGSRVVVNYHRRADAADEVVEAVMAAGGQALAVQADVTREDEVRRLGDAALSAYGRVDVVVNNASPPIERKPLSETSWADVDRYWRTYVHPAHALFQQFVPGMKERGFGRFVHVLTTAMWGTPPAGTGAYVAAKSGLWGLAKTMAVELAPFGITVNAVSPSAVATEQWGDVPDARLRALTMSVPARRLATPDDVAAAVLFLAGGDAGYVTGTNVPVAGGEVM
jgi:3-oxoacyl-[acyl-carrier protein] reductase